MELGLIILRRISNLISVVSIDHHIQCLTWTCWYFMSFLFVLLRSRTSFQVHRAVNWGIRSDCLRKNSHKFDRYVSKWKHVCMEAKKRNYKQCNLSNFSQDTYLKAFAANRIRCKILIGRAWWAFGFNQLKNVTLDETYERNKEISHNEKGKGGILYFDDVAKF